MRCEHGNNKIHCSWCLIKERNALLAENKRIIKLFELLTPGGSEFYNDPDRCYRFAKDSHATMGKVAAERNALRARVAELEEAMLTYIKQSGV